MRYLRAMALGLLITTPFLAEDPATEDPATEGQEAKKEEGYFDRVTVTATGQPINTLDTPASVSVIDRAEIERRAAAGAIDLIRTLPGVQVNGVGLNQSRPVIRGQRGLRVLMLENGLRLNNPRRQTDFGEIAGLVALDRVESVEVLRGPASVLYGSDAIGGVVNLVTAEPRYAPGTLGGEIGASFSSAGDTFDSHTKVGGQLGDFTFVVGAHYRDGSPYQAPSGSFGDITLADTTTVLDTGVQDDGAYGRAILALSEDQRLSLEFGRYRAEGGGFGLVEPDAIGDTSGARIRILYPFQDYDRWTFGWKRENMEAFLADSFDVKAYTQSNERSLVNDIAINFGPFGPPPTPDSGMQFDTTNFTDVDTLGLRAEARKAASRHLITYGIDATEDTSANTDLSINTTTLYFPGAPFPMVDVAVDTIANTPNATNTSYAIFLQDRIQATQRLDLIVGARYQQVETVADPTAGLDVSGLDFDDDALVGSASVAFKVTEGLRVGASFGTAFRAPNIVERLFNGPTPEGSGYQIVNPGLESELSENYELGMKYQRRNAYLNVTLFRNDITDGVIQNVLSPDEFLALPVEQQQEIEALGLEELVVQQINADELRYEGLEFGIGYQFDNGLVIDSNVTHIDAERTDSEIPVQDTAEDRANLTLRYQPTGSRFWGEYRVLYNDGQSTIVDPDAISPLFMQLPDYTIHTVAGGVQLSHRGLTHQIGVTVENVTDELYAEFSNASFFRPQPERSVKVDYRVRF